MQDNRESGRQREGATYSVGYLAGTNFNDLRLGRSRHTGVSLEEGDTQADESEGELVMVELLDPRLGWSKGRSWMLERRSGQQPHPQPQQPSVSQTGRGHRELE